MDSHEPIAIAGMGCRWPGGVRTPQQLWEFLRDQQDGWCEFDDPRYSSGGFYHPNPQRPGTMATKGAFLVDEDARLFDHAFFGISSLEAETLDPGQRKLLEVSYEALENAGESWESVSGTRTGVFVGNFSVDHWMIQQRDWDYPRPYAFSGAGTSILSNRISYAFNLKGPSLTVDTACSSSLYALHLAINALRAGDCDSAIVASSNWIGDPGVQMALDKMGALSATSRCHTFDAKADGYARGEGYAAIYLKKASVAVADGSPIRAIIRGSGINANGRSVGISRPSAAGQEAVIRETYRNAGLPFGDTAYFECHGTGTSVGDPIEVAAIGSVFAADRPSSSPILVGSVKSNIGHSEGASALASIMKVVLSLEASKIPPIYSLGTPNPDIDFSGAKVEVVVKLRDWPEDKLRRASINSFGYGGANGHCIVDHVQILFPEYVKAGVFQPNKSLTNGNTANSPTRNGTVTNGAAENGVATKGAGSEGHQHTDQNLNQRHSPILDSPRMSRSANAATRRRVLLPFSAHSEASIQLNIAALIRTMPHPSLADVAYTLGARRSRLSHRTFRIVSTDDVVDGLSVERKTVRSSPQSCNLGFIFTGQGAQWHAMGAGLFEYRVFRETITYLDEVLRLLPSPPAWSLFDVLSGHCDADLVQSSDVSQAACTALQIGLVDLLASWSVRPAGVVGHSSGEIAAAYASGSITAAAGIVAAYLRGQVVSQNQQRGSMLAVGLGPEKVSSQYLKGLEDKVQLAALNSPNSVTISGDTEAVQQVSAALTADGIFNRMLKTGGNAYHSHHMAVLGRSYVDVLADGLARIDGLGLGDRQHRYPAVPWVSSVTLSKKQAERDVDGWASYWKANLVSPVRFSEAVESLITLNDDQTGPIHGFVEIGPHAALKGPLSQISQSVGKSVPYASALMRNEDGLETMLQLAGTLFCLNYADINLAAVNAVDVDYEGGSGLQHGSIAVDLPPYQYAYGPVNYHESRLSKEYRFREVIRHDLLGSKVPGTAKLQPQWRNILRNKDLPWLDDHRLFSDIALPTAGLLLMALEAASRTYRKSSRALPIIGYSLRDVHVKAALRIPKDDYGVEVITSLSLPDFSDSESPPYAAFAISSIARDSDEWTEHCTGLVKIELSSSLPAHGSNGTDIAETGPFVADARAWYKKLTALGLGYGSAFQTISNIRSTPAGKSISADVKLDSAAGLVKGGESEYIVHPTALEGAFQLGFIACHDAQPEEVVAPFVPHHISRLSFWAGGQETQAIAIARQRRRGLRSSQGVADLEMRTSSGQVILEVQGFSWKSCVDAKEKPVERVISPFASLVWKPDISLLSNRQARDMFPPPKENVDISPLWDVTTQLAHLILHDIYRKFAIPPNGPKPSGEIAHFLAWIKRIAEEDASGAMQEARELSDEALSIRIDELAQQAKDVTEVKIMQLLNRNMADILYERKAGIDVIINENLLTPLYKTGLLMTSIYPQLANIVEHLGHLNPNLRILEIGGGTGGATRIAMKALSGPGGTKRYLDYTFTDVSPGFLSAARESMADLRDVHYSVLDCEVDPLEQGYESAYDLVIACQVLHATSSMTNTMTNVRKLLKPGGRLVLVESNRNFTVPGMVVGTFKGYWFGIPDGRIDAPFQSLDAWDTVLKKTGFSGIDMVLDDFPPPNNTTSVMLSQVISPIVDITKNDDRAADEVQVLYPTETSPLIAEKLLTELTKRGYRASAVPFNQALEHISQHSRVIVLLDPISPSLRADKNHLAILDKVVQISASLMILTSRAMDKVRSLDVAFTAGLLGGLRRKSASGRFCQVDIDANVFDISGDEVDNLAWSVADQQRALDQQSESYVSRDSEFIWQGGCMLVGRYVPESGSSLPHGSQTDLLPLSSQGAICIAPDMPDGLEPLLFKTHEKMLEALPADYIDVKITASSLSRTDLSTWIGRSTASHFSSAYSGIVTSIGAGVTDLKVGDPVYGLGKGQFGNFERMRASMARKLQPHDDAVQMATMPLAYAATIYALDHVVHLRAKQTVLVLSATDDLGFALIRLAQAKGAEIFAVSESQEQADVFINALNLQPSHVVSLQDATHLHQVANKTRKGAFDAIVAIDTPDYDLLHASAQMLAPFGHLVHLGSSQKARGPFDVSLCGSNTTYTRLDPLALLESGPDLCDDLMEAVDSYYRRELIGPIQPLTTIDVAQLSSSSKVLDDISEGRLPGTLVVTFNPEALVRMMPPQPRASFDPNASYIVSGGSYRRVESIVRWMSNRGARKVIVLSSAHQIKGLQERLTSDGVDLQLVVCDASDQAQVLSSIGIETSSSPASSSHLVKGVLHLSEPNLYISPSEALEAEAQATKNLHEATLNYPLDFFVMTSMSSPDAQDIHGTVEPFQQLFARYRRQLGLPASTVSAELISNLDLDDRDNLGHDINTTIEEDSVPKVLSDYHFVRFLEPALLKFNVIPPPSKLRSTTPGPDHESWFEQRLDSLSESSIIACIDPGILVPVAFTEGLANGGAPRNTSTAAVNGSVNHHRSNGKDDGRISHVTRAFTDAKRHGASQDSPDTEANKSTTIASTRRSFDSAITQGGAAERKQTAAFVEEVLKEAVADFLFMDVEGVNTAKSIADHGLDSLVAAELRGWFKQALGVDIKTMELLEQNKTMKQLADSVVERALASKGT